MTMTSDIDFYRVAHTLLDKGMGTENVAHLLYSIVKMYRPKVSLAIGLGYSTLYILKALAENEREEVYDLAVLKGGVPDSGRHEVLYKDYFSNANPTAPILHGIDNFSEPGPHLQNLEESIIKLGLEKFIELHVVDFEAYFYNPAKPEEEVSFIWMDCGHQLDYPALINKFWPLLSPDGGIMAIHYTYVDIDIEQEGHKEKIIIAGAVANAIKKQQLESGISSRFEFISLVEPHKYRQGSVSIIRRIDEISTCRNTKFQDESKIFYGKESAVLIDLNAD
jgi:predicted O-methyltransferase YrrM